LWCPTLDTVFDRVTLVETDTAGRKLVLDVEWADSKLRIFNVYASNDPGIRKTFFRSLRPLMDNFSLLIGDFNTVLSKADLSINIVYKNDVNFGVIDVWRVMNPGVRSFFRRQLFVVLTLTHIKLCRWLQRTGIL
uniref:Endonuclease/exonuclease/phosphatase domain-containing protein n=1 Tax=Oryzias melastigma TaxID=30732 RepID=A0A3B3C9R6_ORYME